MCGSACLAKPAGAYSSAIVVMQTWIDNCVNSPHVRGSRRARGLAKSRDPPPSNGNKLDKKWKNYIFTILVQKYIGVLFCFFKKTQLIFYFSFQNYFSVDV